MNYVHIVNFSLDGRLLASGSSDDTVRLWLTEKKTLLQRIELKNSRKRDIQFSRDGLQLILKSRFVEILSAPLTFSLQKPTSADMTYSLSDEDQWVAWKSCDFLWLPFNYRPGRYRFKDNTLAIGSRNGRVNFLSFNTKALPF